MVRHRRRRSGGGWGGKGEKKAGRSFSAQGDPRVYKRRSPVRAGAVRHNEQELRLEPPGSLRQLGTNRTFSPGAMTLLREL